ncbi:YeiH family protein [Avibacterium sp. 20-15]|uniref:YeiH family protein n=1 Tax=unclassified Avibacterium TaxID=2685287 RepID=UPI0020274582|nr:MULTISPECIES: YeiH family protein [unclassified Avibacterium]MCW9733280.1 YeiH family protein [Avibacterium sp. 20-15]URL05473.1 YeiH family protein [Avibacterium sp. 20-132]
MKHLSLLPGLFLTILISLLASSLAQTPLALSWHISALTLAILLGILGGNTFYHRIESVMKLGVTFAKGILLRCGIVLFGFRLTLQDISQVGLNAFFSDLTMLILTFLLTCWIGIKWLKIDRQIVQLTASGCSICGAAAIMATEPILKAPSYKVSVAVALIVIFGTVSMFLYPLLYPYLQAYLPDHLFGIYIGSTVHEVAQVYAAGANITPQVADTAVIAKMLRVMMLAPLLLALSYFLRKESGEQQGKIVIPYFALLFIGVAIFNSFNVLPPFIVDFLVQLDRFLLMMVMAALGLTTHINSLKQAGTKPLLLGAIIWIWLMVGGLGINLIFAYLLA